QGHSRGQADLQPSEGRESMMQTYAYYPGCTLHSSAKEYDVSARLVCAKLGIELKELEGWTCCGASSAHTTNPQLSVALPARDLQSAEEMGLPLAVACAMCFSRLKHTAHELAEKAKLDSVNSLLGKDFHNSTRVVHLLEILAGATDEISAAKPLKGLKIASYYGCLLVRPHEIMKFDDEENPQIMDKLMKAVGAEPVAWDFKTACCGASLPFTRRDIVVKLSHRILAQARQLGADCVAVACPMCQINLDMQQSQMEAVYQDRLDLPILYFTQLVGLAMGFSPKQLLFDKHFVNPLPMLKARGLA
ncbi:MAG: CoB--CoM heterodisulfide reductase iron-sulfur subunit B family protein, partial [Chloroflexi bacterium]|nr:CoB--CoM heterodisulfide reductase iron-sulfur subunit B family protein [Chloroflexota bacterium]